MRSRLIVAFFATSMALILLVGLLGQGWAATGPTLSAIVPADAGRAQPPAPGIETAVPATLAQAATGPGPAEAVGSPTMRAVADAYAVGASRFSRLAVAVLDLRSGRFYAAGDVDARYPAASVVKVFTAARLLVEGRAGEPRIRDIMHRMIVCSDDDAGSSLYYLVGGDGLMPWISNHYGVEGLTAPSEPGWWGTTGITARGLVDFYAKVAEDPAVGPWLREAMGSTQPFGCDGFYQHYGLPSAAAGWQVKQGWMCCMANLSRMHSTGYVNDRYAVALLAEGGTWTYGRPGAEALTRVAQTLLPSGVLPAYK